MLYIKGFENIQLQHFSFTIMKKIKLSKSQRKFVRLHKSRIRREILGLKEQREQIGKLYSQFLPAEKASIGSKADKPKKKKEEKVEKKEEKSKKQTSRKTKREAKETK